MGQRGRRVVPDSPSPSPPRSPGDVGGRTPVVVNLRSRLRGRVDPNRGRNDHGSGWRWVRSLIWSSDWVLCSRRASWEGHVRLGTGHHAVGGRCVGLQVLTRLACWPTMNSRGGSFSESTQDFTLKKTQKGQHGQGHLFHGRSGSRSEVVLRFH